MNDLSPEARALIEDARPAERPDLSAKSRVRAALTVQLSLPPAHPPQPPIPPAVSAAGAGVATKLALVCALTTTAVVGGFGAHRWISSSRAPDRAGQSSLRPVAPLQEPSRPSEAPSLSLPPAIKTIPIAEAEGDSSPASKPFHRSRTPVLSRSPSATQSRTGEMKVTPAPPTLAASVEAARSGPVPHAGSLSVSKERPTEPPRSASPRTPERDVTGPVQRPGESVARSLPARHKTGCSTREELRLLGAAQVALREGRAKLALNVLEQHTSLCPSARFNEEHSTVHILALCLLRQREQALAEATQLATLAPTSPQLARLRTSCAAAGVEKAARDKARP